MSLDFFVNYVLDCSQEVVSCNLPEISKYGIPHLPQGA